MVIPKIRLLIIILSNILIIGYGNFSGNESELNPLYLVQSAHLWQLVMEELSSSPSLHQSYNKYNKFNRL